MRRSISYPLALVGFFAAVGMVSLVVGAPAALAQQKSRIWPLDMVKNVMTTTKESGWVAFSNQRSTQNIYFSHLQSYHCSLKEIRYSYNSKTLDKIFPLAECNPQIPMNVPGEPKWIVNLEKPGTVKTIAVQVVFSDDTTSEIAVYEPCKDVGDQVCTWLVE